MELIQSMSNQMSLSGYNFRNLACIKLILLILDMEHLFSKAIIVLLRIDDNEMHALFKIG